MNMNNNTSFKNNIRTASENSLMLLPNGNMLSMDGYATKLNNNTIVMGTSGSSKTRSVIAPNLLSCVDSYVVSDPKGYLLEKYGGYLRDNGYDVKVYDFIHPDRSDGYNPFAYARTPDDIMRLSHYIIYGGNENSCTKNDPFWDQSAELLLSSIIGYMEDSECEMEKRTMAYAGRLLTLIDASVVENGERCRMDNTMSLMNSAYRKKYGKDAWSYMQYKKFRQSSAKTFNCVIMTIQAHIASLDTPALNDLYERETIRFEEIGTKKTAVFVVVSDSDRSKDALANTFYTQAMNALCTFADDKCEDRRLPVPVRFMMDDFATNCRIVGFENMISNIRSRNISATIVLQSMSQLSGGYGDSARTIVDNCDTIIYMGGNDLTTANEISQRANKPLSEILDMAVSTNWVFRRGSKPVFARTIDVDEYDLPAPDRRTTSGRSRSAIKDTIIKTEEFDFDFDSIA